MLSSFNPLCVSCLITITTSFDASGNGDALQGTWVVGIKHEVVTSNTPSFTIDAGRCQVPGRADRMAGNRWGIIRDHFALKQCRPAPDPS
jgi:hypothetical protein